MSLDQRTKSDRAPDRSVDYRTLFGAHFTGLVRLAALLGADDPEDIAQEAFVRLHHRASVLRDPHAALGYLRRTVVNLTHTRLRHLRVVRRHTPALADLLTVASAEHTVLAQDRCSRLVLAMLALPARQRQVLVLRYWLDLPFTEIADIVRMRPASVRSALSRAQQALRSDLEDPR